MGSTHNEVFANKKQLWLLCPKQADLTHSELLVYSYRAWQDTWQEQARHSQGRQGYRTLPQHGQEGGLAASDPWPDG